MRRGTQQSPASNSNSSNNRSSTRAIFPGASISWGILASRFQENHLPPRYETGRTDGHCAPSTSPSTVGNGEHFYTTAHTPVPVSRYMGSQFSSFSLFGQRGNTAPRDSTGVRQIVQTPYVASGSTGASGTAHQNLSGSAKVGPSQSSKLKKKANKANSTPTHSPSATTTSCTFDSTSCVTTPPAHQPEKQQHASKKPAETPSRSGTRRTVCTPEASTPSHAVACTVPPGFSVANDTHLEFPSTSTPSLTTSQRHVRNQQTPVIPEPFADHWQPTEDDIRLLTRVLKSFYTDMLRPFQQDLKRRIRECGGSEELLAHFLEVYQTRDDLFIVSEWRGKPVVTLVNPPHKFRGWIDPNDGKDPYPEQLWEEFKQYITDMLRASQSEHDVLESASTATPSTESRANSKNCQQQQQRQACLCTCTCGESFADDGDSPSRNLPLRPPPGFEDQQPPSRFSTPKGKNNSPSTITSSADLNSASDRASPPNHHDGGGKSNPTATKKIASACRRNRCLCTCVPGAEKESSIPAKSAPVYQKGGRYGMASELYNRNLALLRGYSLGEVCHIVQLAIVKGILAYENELLKPVSACTKISIANCSTAIGLPAESQMSNSELGFPHIEQKGQPVSNLEQAKEVVASVLANEPEGIHLAHLKQRILKNHQRYITPTAFGYEKLSALLSSGLFADTCYLLRDDRQNHMIVQSTKFPIRLGAKPFISSKTEAKARLEESATEPARTAGASDAIASFPD
eukprot:Selendium_serpulae@DN5973_c0_g1_i9.p1